jgi:hypothetical protein
LSAKEEDLVEEIVAERKRSLVCSQMSDEEASDASENLKNTGDIEIAEETKY